MRARPTETAPKVPRVEFIINYLARCCPVRVLPPLPLRIRIWMQVAGIWLQEQSSLMVAGIWMQVAARRVASRDATASRYSLVRACERELGNQHHLSGGR